ncbi:aldehyde dehydrogenase family protein [Bradyrhizobium sp. TZ2]
MKDRNGTDLTLINPANEQEIGRVAMATPSDLVSCRGVVCPNSDAREKGNRTQAIGAVAAFTTWNYPAVLNAWKLAAGCPVILKAAEESPSATVHVVEALHDAGIPPGVVSLVFWKSANGRRTPARFAYCQGVIVHRLYAG